MSYNRNKVIQIAKAELGYLEKSGDYEGACWHESAECDGSMERWYAE